MSGRHKPRKDRIAIAPTAGRRREQNAIITEVPGKAAEIRCPFCYPPHALLVGQAAHCGTVLELRAVQRLYVGVDCMKCGKSTGTLIKAGTGYEHAHDCSPGKIVLQETPPASRSAALAYRLPLSLKVLVEASKGKAATKLTDPDGKVIYAWL